MVVFLLQGAGKGCILSEILTYEKRNIYIRAFYSFGFPSSARGILQQDPGQALQTSRYRSTLELPGAASSTVTLATTTAGTGSLWNCTVLQTASFDEARSRFAEIYNQLSNNIITTQQQKTFILNGQYETPSQDKKFTQVMFSLLPGVGDMKRLHVELTMDAVQQGWVVAINVSDEDPREIAKF
jgi:hypothetical protein